MIEKKNKSPKDIEKRKAKTKKIIFFILHGISYILSIMFIGALVIGGCSQKANTYKSANASYVNERVTDIDSINLNDISAYNYQLFSDDFTYNLPSYNVSKNYLGDWDEIVINYNNVVSKSGQNVLTKISYHSWGLELFGDNVGDDSLFRNGFRINLTQLNNSSGLYEEQFYIEDIVEEESVNYISLSYVLSEFFDGTISILNYDSVTFSSNDNSLTVEKSLKFVCFYFSNYSITNINTRINNDLAYYYNRVLNRPDFYNTALYGFSQLSSDVIDSSFIVGDFTYGGSHYDSVYIQCKKFGLDVSYIQQGDNVYRYDNIVIGGVNGNVYYINYVAFYNSYSGLQYNYIVPVTRSYNNSLCLTGFNYKINPSYQIIRFHNLAAYTSDNINFTFSGSGRTENIILMRSQIFKVLNYSSDYNSSTGETLINVFDLISTGFSGLGGILGIAILPSLTIGTLLAIPLVMVLVLFIIKLFKR